MKDRKVSMIFNRPEEELLKFDSYKKANNFASKATFDDKMLNRMNHVQSTKSDVLNRYNTNVSDMEKDINENVAYQRYQE